MSAKFSEAEKIDLKVSGVVLLYFLLFFVWFRLTSY
jgi:hypothetical protein